MTLQRFLLYLQFLLCICMALPATGQKYLSQHFSTGMGLAHANVFRIFQDQRGFIWMGTNSGLSRFDGRNFHNYFIKDGLTDNCIMSVSETPHGELLIGTYNGGLCIRNDSVIKSYPLKGGHMPKRVFYSFALGKDIWLIGQDSILQVYLIEDSVIKQIPLHSKSGRDVFVYSGVQYHNNELYLATSDGIYRATQKKSLEKYIPSLHEKVTAISSDRAGGFWVGMTGKLVRIKNGNIIQSIPVSEKSVIGDILVDRNHKVWVALVGEGVCTLRNNQLENVNPLLDITTTSINDMMEDKEGNIWIATHGQGTFLVNGKQNIQHYPVQKNKLNVYCEYISDYNGKLFIASIGTVSIWEDGMLKPFRVDLLHRSNYVYFAQVYDDKLYVGTSAGLIVKDMKPPYKERYATLDGKGTRSGVISIYRDRNKNIWIGGYYTLYRYQNGMLKADSNYNINENRRINAITESSKGEIWIGTDKGIIIYDGEQYYEWYGNLKPFPAYVQCLYEDSKGRMWIGSRHGLLLVDKDKEKISLVPMEKTDINDICEDSNNVIWLATAKGLKYVRPGERKTEDFYTGVYTEEVSVLYTKGDTLFAGTTAGMLFINDNSILDISKKDPPPVYITAATTGSETIYMPRRIVLPYKNNKLTINFTGLNYESPDKTLYRYKIEGLDNNWHITPNNSIELPALPDGNYTLYIQAQNNHGQWSESSILPMRIETPFWKKWWAYTLAAIVSSFLFYLIIKKIITTQEKQKRNRLLLYNKMAYLKQQALSALINPHFIFNCMNSIQHYLNEHDNDTANEYLSDFAGLIRMTMEHATEAFIDLDKEIKRINLYMSLEQLRFGDELKFSCVVDPSLDAGRIRIPNMVLQPYLENAIWHGIMPKNGIGEIEMHVRSMDKDHIIITVKDDGVGIFNSASIRNKNKKSALGMSLIRERMALLKKLLKQKYMVSAREITDEVTGDVKGTLVEILVPIFPKEEVLDKLETDNRMKL